MVLLVLTCGQLAARALLLHFIMSKLGTKRAKSLTLRLPLLWVPTSHSAQVTKHNRLDLQKVKCFFFHGTQVFAHVCITTVHNIFATFSVSDIM